VGRSIGITVLTCLSTSRMALVRVLMGAVAVKCYVSDCLNVNQSKSGWAGSIPGALPKKGGRRQGGANYQRIFLSEKVGPQSEVRFYGFKK
jgi:hypothetical protein